MSNKKLIIITNEQADKKIDDMAAELWKLRTLRANEQKQYMNVVTKLRRKLAELQTKKEQQ